MKNIITALIGIALAFAIQTSYALNNASLESNKRNVIEFYDKLINQKNFDAAAIYLGPSFTQHNPTAADGLAGLKAFVQYLRDNYPDAHSEIRYLLMVIMSWFMFTAYVYQVREEELYLICLNWRMERLWNTGIPRKKYLRHQPTKMVCFNQN